MNSLRLLCLMQISLHSVLASTPCTNEITTVDAFYDHKQKGTFDLIVDVRTLSEYTGDGNVACNTGKADKCNMGHDPDMFMLVNNARTDKAVLYKVNGTNTVDPEIVKSLKACYGAHAATMKIAVSCHSGSRSAAMQQALVDAGFTCGNMYNVKPGADGMWKANATKMVKGNTKKGPWSCSAAPPPKCTNEITTVDAFYEHKKQGTFDLIVDVRTLSEYTGDGNVACNTGKANKCNMGHDPDMFMLVNNARTDKAVLYKVNGKNTVDPEIVKSLKACYGAKAATMKIAVSCHSGSRSAAMQQALVDAGFKCGNMYNVKPGADGMWKANATKMVKGNTKKGAWSCPSSTASTSSTTGALTSSAPFSGLLTGGFLSMLSFLWMGA